MSESAPPELITPATWVFHIITAFAPDVPVPLRLLISALDVIAEIEGEPEWRRAVPAAVRWLQDADMLVRDPSQALRVNPAKRMLNILPGEHEHWHDMAQYGAEQALLRAILVDYARPPSDVPAPTSGIDADMLTALLPHVRHVSRAAMHRADAPVATLLTLAGIGMLWAAELEQARAALEQAVAIYELNQADQSPDLADALHALGAIWGYQHDAEQAQHYYRRALAIRERTFGDAHPSTLETLAALGTRMLGQDQYYEAAALLDRARTGFEQLGDTGVDVALVLYALGGAQRALDNPAAARSAWEHARRLFEQNDHLATRYVPGLVAHLAEIDLEEGQRTAAIMRLARAIVQYAPSDGSEPPEIARLREMLRNLTK